jgi:hypothetical protein
LLATQLKEKELLLNDQESRLAKLTDLQHERDYQLKMIIEQRRKIGECEVANDINARLTRELTKVREECQEVKLINEELEKSHTLACQVIEERTAALANVRTMLDRSMKSDERKQQQIDSLQKERHDLLAEVQDLTEQLQMKKETKGITSEIAVVNEELEITNRKLQEKLDKSSEMYAALLYEFRQGSSERGIKTMGSFSREIFVVFEKDNGRMNEKTVRRKRLSASAEKEAKLVNAAYLKKVVLQYFSLEKESERNTMVPILLELVGCTVEQIAVVNRHLQRNQSLIARTVGLFRF